MKNRAFWFFPAFVGLLLFAVIVGDVVEYVRMRAAYESSEQLFSARGATRLKSSSSWQDFDFKEGWSVAERQGRWAIGPTAGLTVQVKAPAARTLLFDCRPYHDPTIKERQTITVAINGDIIEIVELRIGLAVYSVEIPEGTLQAGSNDVTLMFAYHRPPEKSGKAGLRRSLSVFFRSMSLVGPETV